MGPRRYPTSFGEGRRVNVLLDSDALAAYSTLSQQSEVDQTQFVWTS